MRLKPGQNIWIYLSWKILDGDKPHIDIIDGRTVKWDDGREMVGQKKFGAVSLHFDENELKTSCFRKL